MEECAYLAENAKFAFWYGELLECKVFVLVVCHIEFQFLYSRLLRNYCV